MATKKKPAHRMENATDSTTIKEVRAFLTKYARTQEGAIEPASLKYIKIYQYSLAAHSMRSLMIIYKFDKEHPGQSLHVQNYFASFRLNANKMGYSVLQHWGLTKMSEEPPEGGKRATGHWYITQKGRDFVEEKITLPSYVIVYNKKLQKVEYEGKLKSMREVLKDFNFDELMATEIQGDMRSVFMPERKSKKKA